MTIEELFIHQKALYFSRVYRQKYLPKNIFFYHKSINTFLFIFCLKAEKSIFFIKKSSWNMNNLFIFSNFKPTYLF